MQSEPNNITGEIDKPPPSCQELIKKREKGTDTLFFFSMPSEDSVNTYCHMLKSLIKGPIHRYFHPGAVCVNSTTRSSEKHAARVDAIQVSGESV
jgi:hypothetical protein